MAFFNNPAFGQAASSLMQALAPPSGADAAGWSQARARQEEAARLQWLFDNHGDPSASQRSALTGVQGFSQTPEGFRYNVDQGNLTQRYGYDTQAATSRANNAADNAAAMERLGITDATQRYGIDRTFDASRLNNTDNNARAIQERQMQEEAAMARQLASPIAVNQGQRVFLPPAVASEVDLPALLEGGSAPLSETQWNANQNQRLLEEGSLTDDMLLETIMGGKSPVQAVGPDGRPVFMSPGAAVRDGAEAFVNQGGGTGPRMYRTTDGRSGITHDGGLTDAHSKERLPQGTQLSTTADTSETFGSGETAKVRADVLDRRAATQSMIDQAKFIDERLASVDAGAATGVIGSTARVLNDIASQVQYGAQLAGIEVPAEVRDLTNYQGTLRELGVVNAEVQSGIVDLAYSMAQSRKGGRLNVQDVENAIRTIGGNLQDPVALRRVLRGAVNRSITDYGSYENIMRQQYGDTLNLSPNTFSPFGEDPAAPAAAAPAQGGPQPGMVEDGYRFKGGDPGDPANWERVN